MILLLYKQKVYYIDAGNTSLDFFPAAFFRLDVSKRHFPAETCSSWIMDGAVLQSGRGIHVSYKHFLDLGSSLRSVQRVRNVTEQNAVSVAEVGKIC